MKLLEIGYGVDGQMIPVDIQKLELMVAVEDLDLPDGGGPARVEVETVVAALREVKARMSKESSK